MAATSAEASQLVPDEPFPNFTEEIYVVQKRRATDFKAPKVRKGSSGSSAR